MIISMGSNQKVKKKPHKIQCYNIRIQKVQCLKTEPGVELTRPLGHGSTIKPWRNQSNGQIIEP